MDILTLPLTLGAIAGLLRGTKYQIVANLAKEWSGGLNFLLTIAIDLPLFFWLGTKFTSLPDLALFTGGYVVVPTLIWQLNMTFRTGKFHFPGQFNWLLMKIWTWVCCLLILHVANIGMKYIAFTYPTELSSLPPFFSILTAIMYGGEQFVASPANELLWITVMISGILILGYQFYAWLKEAY